MRTLHLLLPLCTSLVLPTAFAAEAPATATKPAAEKPKANPKPRVGTKWDAMDHGPFLSSYLDTTPKVNKAVSIDLGEGAAVGFDTEMLKLAVGWTGGFVRLPTGRDGLEGMPKPGGTNFAFAAPKGPGWALADGALTDDRPVYRGKPYGPLPREHAKYRGLHLQGSSVILDYTVGDASVLEAHSYRSALNVFERHLEVRGAKAPLTAALLDATGAEVKIDGSVATVTRKDGQVSAVALLGRGELSVSPEKAVVVKIPADAGRLTVVYASGDEAAQRAQRSTMLRIARPELASMVQKPGGPRWGEPIPVPGRLATSTSPGFPYVVDTIPAPDENPFKSWIRGSGVDFFADGTTAALCSVSGDVWLVRHIDDKLDKVTWQRFATGLFQPLGLRIVDNKVYVLGRDQITRLSDLNGDGEADYYENFNNDVAAFQAYHEFALDLQSDSQGNFYFAKGGNLGNADHPHHGTILKVSKDGSKLEPIITGLRAPNGMGMGPNDEISVSDNEGNWVPSSRFSIVKPGGFYGHVFTSHRDPKPTTYDNPVCWLPKYVDNSSGGQVWVKGDKWGPFADQMLFLSYGHCSLFKVLLDRVDGEYQGGVVKFPLKFDTGIMRGRFNNRDGQLYLTGLSVWQSDGAKVGRMYRVRYTGGPVHLPTGLRATTKGVALTFTDALDPASAADVGNYSVTRWNYQWAERYGSENWSVEDPKKHGGNVKDDVVVSKATLSADGKTVFLTIPTIKPVMQQRIVLNLKAADGAPVKADIHHSIYRLAAE